MWSSFVNIHAILVSKECLVGRGRVRLVRGRALLCSARERSIGWAVDADAGVALARLAWSRARFGGGSSGGRVVSITGGVTDVLACPMSVFSQM